MKTEAGYAKQLVTVTTGLCVFVTDASSAIRAFPNRILTAWINPYILDGRRLDDLTIHLQFQNSLLAMMVTAKSGAH